MHVNSVSSRQWPEVYDLSRTLLHVEQVKKPTAMRDISCYPRMAVGFLTSAT